MLSHSLTLAISRGGTGSPAIVSAPAQASVVHGDVSAPRRRRAIRTRHQRPAAGHKGTENTHLQQGLARGMSTRSGQLIEPRRSFGEAADHFDLLTQ